MGKEYWTLDASPDTMDAFGASCCISALVSIQMGLDMQASEEPALSIHSVQGQNSRCHKLQWLWQSHLLLSHECLSECLLVCIWWIFGPTFVELPAPEDLKSSLIFCVSKSTPERRWKKRSSYFWEAHISQSYTTWWLIWPCTDELRKFGPILFSKLIQMCSCSWEL